MARFNVLRAAQPNAIICGCYFHLMQYILQKKKKNRHEIDCKRNEGLQNFVPCLH